MKKQTAVIVGAGPIGLETALRARHVGYDVIVLERGVIGAGVRHWKHVKLFTPFSMNSSEAGRAASQTQIKPDQLVTGAELADEYLRPLANSGQLQGRVHENHEVLAVSRSAYGKSDRIGSPTRDEAAFRILTKTPRGEQIFHADVLIDCSGFITLHRHLGAGGIPCPGEQLLKNHCYQIPNAAIDYDRFAGRHAVVVGSGYSAATSICVLAEIARGAPDTKITWVTRSTRPTPMVSMLDDPLAEREQLTITANELAASSDSCVDWIPGPQIESISQTGEQICVELLWNDEAGEGRAQQILADEIVANVGYRPDTRPFEELQVHRCYATEGPIKLAAHLLGETSSDCLQQSSGGASLLKNPEPDFYILGAASYGRDARFLLQTGLQQVTELFDDLKAQSTGVSA